MKNWPIILVVSCGLGLSGCGLFRSKLPPCDRTDVVEVYDAQGNLHRDVTGIKNPCVERMLRDLDVCYGEAK